MKVHVTYEVDGRFFKSAEEALAYERSRPSFRMYTETGKRTHCNDEAVIVHFPDEECAKAFIRDCKEAGNLWDGLNDYSTGWWHWDNGEYVPISEELINFFTAKGANLDD